MLSSEQLERAVTIHERSYKLLQWLAGAMAKGFVPTASAHDTCSGGEVSLKWMERHYLNLPVACRPDLEDMVPFANFFGSYLETSFDVIENPGFRHEYSPDFCCAFCSRVVKASHLVPKPVDAREKKRAAKLRIRRLEVLALEEGIVAADDVLASLSSGSMLRDAALSAYGASLVERINGVCSGFGVLALWREIAWHKGSPDRQFRLKSGDVVAAEGRLVSAIRQASLAGACSRQ